MKPLAGQKILLIGIGFYDYEAAIAAELRALGAEVWIEDERAPEMRGKLASLRRRMDPDMTAARRRHQTAMLARASKIGRLDHLVVIKGELLDDAFLQALRGAQPHAQFTAYHWDSMERYPDLIRRQALFDRVLTFDHADAAREPRFLLRPLFYRPELYRDSTADVTIDLCFVGWLHHDRLQQIDGVRAQARALGLTLFVYLSTGPWTGLRMRLSGIGRDVRSRPLPFDRYVEKSLGSRAILDLPHPRQTGLTMRTVEAIGMNRKLITTAVDVRTYDFYRAENVCIVDPAELRIDPAFLAVPQVALPAGLMERYSLRAWVLDVLGVTNPTDFRQE